MASSLMQPVVFSLINYITGKGQEGGFLPLLALLLMTNVLGKGVGRTAREHNDLNKSF